MSILKNITLVWIFLIGLSAAVSAQTQVDTTAVERAVKKGLDAKYAEEMLLEKEIWAAWKTFCKQADALTYNNYADMFHSMDGLRRAYMTLRNISPEAAVACAPRINELVYVDGHKRGIRLASYINMEAGNLPESERNTFDDFGRALAGDVYKAILLPGDFLAALASFREYVEKSRELKVPWMFQSLMPLMDAFTKGLREHPGLGPAMAKEIQRPIQAGWGGWVVPSRLITDHACEMWTIQDDLEAFGNKLVQLSK